ncbi:MAG: diadenylate cyclase [Bacillales bacterium]
MDYILLRNILIEEGNKLNFNSLLDLILTFVMLVLLNLFIIRFVKRHSPRIIAFLLSIIYLLALIYDIKYLSNILGICLIINSLISLSSNLPEIRSIFTNKANPEKKIKHNKENLEIKTYDRNSMYKTIQDTVLFLSKHKIGAIITFERSDKLDNIIKNGTTINCPLTFEILVTIFYPGTRLHDGAVIIRDGKILAASVYYNPTTNPLPGKYGSRHRAAIGISEICDAVTVVVSEETGRISIAYDGNLESYNPDNFEKAFRNIMNATESIDISKERE